MNLINTLNILHSGYILPYYPSYRAKMSTYETNALLAGMRFVPHQFSNLWPVFMKVGADIWHWRTFQGCTFLSPKISNNMAWHVNLYSGSGSSDTSLSLRCCILLYNVIINNMPAMKSSPYLLVWWWQITNQWSQANEIWKRQSDH
jgi:hypothetical protein